MIRTSLAASLRMRALLAIAPRDEHGSWRWIWERLWRPLAADGRYVRIPLHGAPAVLNAGNSYPYYARIFPHWNEPLLAALKLVAGDGRASFVDVGAATGDTILMLHRNAPDSLGPVLAIEGDPGFAECLRENIRRVPDAVAVQTMLSAVDGSEIASLERHHPGSATASGDGKVESRTLDSVWLENGSRRIDLLKTDVDGFDGVVLAGARRLLREARPAVLFEWHPPLCHGAGNDPRQVFEVLSSEGYDRFVWFDKYGRFQQVDVGWSEAQLAARELLCGRDDPPDVHWDVLAVPSDATFDWTLLAKPIPRGTRRSRW